MKMRRRRPRVKGLAALLMTWAVATVGGCRIARTGYAPSSNSSVENLIKRGISYRLQSQNNPAKPCGRRPLAPKR